MRLLEAGQDHRQQAHSIVIRDAEADAARELVIHEQVNDLGVDPQHPSRPRIKGIALARHHHAAPVA
ncbi:hypothetical protein D3C83_193880 [compost metagenome]